MARTDEQYVEINPASGGFDMYDTQRGDRGYDIVGQCYEAERGEIIELGSKDELPEGVEDIRGRIYNEPDRVFAIVHEPDCYGEPYITYFGIDELD